MITGANTNVRYRGIVFHVQTEDSGRANPHIISHVYHDGTILASEKTVYSDRVDAEDLGRLVRELIESQHAQMLTRLKSGGLDTVIAERLGDTAVEPSGPVEAPTPAPELASAGPPAEGHEPSEAGAPAEGVGPDEAAEPVGSETPAVARAFGEGIGSQKPLDEMILDYLSQKARDRASARASRSARKTNSNG